MHTDSLLINALYYLLAAVIAVPFFKWVLVARVGHIDATVRMNPDIIGTIKGFSLIAVGDHRDVSITIHLHEPLCLSFADQ